MASKQKDSFSSLRGKVIAVIGATSGIGAATSVALARNGARVLVCGRREAQGDAVVRDVQAHGGEATYVHCDVMHEDDVKHVVQVALDMYGRLDGAFNNAGIYNGDAGKYNHAAESTLY